MPHPAVYIATGVAVVAAALFAIFYNNNSYLEQPHKKSSSNKTHDDFQFLDTSLICTICLCDCKVSLTYLSCGHCFHRNCITKWMNMNDICPNCKKPARII